MNAPRKNMERMDEYVIGGSCESYQAFISESLWDYIKLNEQLCSDVNEILGGSGSVPCINESAFIKKGKSSVVCLVNGMDASVKLIIARLGVYASLCDGTHSSMIDCRLFVPVATVK